MNLMWMKNAFIGVGLGLLPANLAILAAFRNNLLWHGAIQMILAVVGAVCLITGLVLKK